MKHKESQTLLRGVATGALAFFMLFRPSVRNKGEFYGRTTV
jgi:hypothetical protein